MRYTTVYMSRATLLRILRRAACAQTDRSVEALQVMKLGLSRMLQHKTECGYRMSGDGVAVEAALSKEDSSARCDVVCGDLVAAAIAFGDSKSKVALRLLHLGFRVEEERSQAAVGLERRLAA